MQNRKMVFGICTVVIIFCIIMAIVDGIIQANYFVKSAIKFGLFLVVPILYGVYCKELKIKPLFAFDKQGIKLATGLCIGVYAVILGGYMIFKNIFDFSKITGALTDNIGVTEKNFIFVSLYISFVNSLLEEFFFRGFAFLGLKSFSKRRFAYIFSAGIFALYHVAMMIGWFSIWVILLALAGLFAGGIIFNFFNSVFPS